MHTSCQRTTNWCAHIQSADLMSQLSPSDGVLLACVLQGNMMAGASEMVQAVLCAHSCECLIILPHSALHMIS